MRCFSTEQTYSRLFANSDSCSVSFGLRAGMSCKGRNWESSATLLIALCERLTNLVSRLVVLVKLGISLANSLNISASVDKILFANNCCYAMHAPTPQVPIISGTRTIFPYVYLCYDFLDSWVLCVEEMPFARPAFGDAIIVGSANEVDNTVTTNLFSTEFFLWHN